MNRAKPDIAYTERPTHIKASYAPDGILYGDWRLVRKCDCGGRVKGWGHWWESPDLAQYVGKWVWVQAGEYWVVWVEVFVEPFNFDFYICRIDG